MGGICVDSSGAVIDVMVTLFKVLHEKLEQDCESVTTAVTRVSGFSCNGERFFRSLLVSDEPLTETSCLPLIPIARRRVDVKSEHRHLRDKGTVEDSRRASGNPKKRR